MGEVVGTEAQEVTLNSLHAKFDKFISNDFAHQVVAVRDLSTSINSLSKKVSAQESKMDSVKEMVSEMKSTVSLLKGELVTIGPLVLLVIGALLAGAICT